VKSPPDDLASWRDIFGRRAAGGAPLLYALLDTGLVVPAEMEEEARALAAGGADVIQLRAKELGGGELFDLSQRLHQALVGTRVPLVLNDRVDVAVAAGLEGVHVGAEDLPAEDARRIMGPRAIVGVTVHDLAELGAVSPLADYVGYGAVFPTSTRPGSSVCGAAALTRSAAGTSLPMIAIGGLGPGNVEALRGAAIAGVAVGSAISPARGGAEALTSLRRILDGWAGFGTDSFGAPRR
jgi:thiamine-phosphate pyrophosphorylase